MTTVTLHPLAAAYLDRLRRQASGLPRSVRHELMSEIETHLAEATTAGMSDAEVLTALDRLGDPADIVAAQRHDASWVAPAGGRGVHEWAAIFLLLLGGFFFGIGWIAGLILLWSSTAWRTRDKWLGTLVVPGGLAAVLTFFLIVANSPAQVCTEVTGAAPVPLRSHLFGLQVARHCVGGWSTPHEIAAVAALVVLLAAPIGVAIHLSRRAGAPIAA